jgi:hypothetical protein
MTQREINAKLFLLIVKTIGKGESKLVDVITKVCSKVTLEPAYIHDFITIMLRKDMLKTRMVDVTSPVMVSLTKLACDKVREMNAQQAQEEELVNYEIVESPAGIWGFRDGIE